jgi:hypothetical protein
MKRVLALGLMLGVVVAILPRGSSAAPTEKDKAAAKEALQAVQDFVGDWKGAGGPDKTGKAPPGSIWSEKVSWGWSFKGEEPKLVFTIDKGKFLKSGELRYLTDVKKYELKAVRADGKTAVFVGDLKNDVLTLERTDPETKEIQQLIMNSAAEGVRFIYRYQTKAADSTLFKKEYLVAANREGESLGPTAKKNLCVVSGGVGTTQISYKGETYYLCCSGCAEAFKENPEKYIAEFKAKQNKK